MRTANSIYLTVNDNFPRQTFVLQAMGAAWKRSGVRIITRDTSDSFLLSQLIRDLPPYAKVVETVEFIMPNKHQQAVEYAQAKGVMGMNLDWLLPQDAFLPYHTVQRIGTIWTHDLHLLEEFRLKRLQKTCSFDDCLKHEKSIHLCWHPAAEGEAEMLGLKYISFPPAAPLEWTQLPIQEAREPRFLFIGNIGHTEYPLAKAVRAIELGGSLELLRKMALKELLYDPLIASWSSKEPSLPSLVKDIFELKISDVNKPFAKLFDDNQISSSNASCWLKEQNLLMKFLYKLKNIFRYDRPALAYKLVSRGLINIYSSDQERWEWYGLYAFPKPPIHQLPQLYMKHIGYVDIPDAIQESFFSEKAFEAAACGRLPLFAPHVPPPLKVPTAPDVDSWINFLTENYGTFTFAAQHEAEARKQIVETHTWDHRINLVHFSELEETAP